MTQSYETIETRIDGRVAILTLNRPQVLNAINGTLMAEVTAAMAGFVADPQILAIVLQGNGRAFSAGFDMKESALHPVTDIEGWRKVIGDDFDFLIQFWDCPKPTIAAVHGFALAGGFEMALSCDMTVAAEGTCFGEPEVRFGSGIVALLLPWITTPKFAKEMLLTGNDQIDARRALAMGIVNHVRSLGQRARQGDAARARRCRLGVAVGAAHQARDQPRLRHHGNAPGTACRGRHRRGDRKRGRPGSRGVQSASPRTGPEGCARLARREIWRRVRRAANGNNPATQRKDFTMTGRRLHPPMLTQSSGVTRRDLLRRGGALGAGLLAAPALLTSQRADAAEIAGVQFPMAELRRTPKSPRS